MPLLTCIGLPAVASTETASELLQRAAEPAGSSDQPAPFDGRAFRRSLGKTGRYTRNPRNDKESLALMDEHGVGYSLTGLIAQMRDTNKVWQQVRASTHLSNSRLGSNAWRPTTVPHG